MKCTDVMSHFTDIVLEMDDKYGLIIKPENYLTD